MSSEKYTIWIGYTRNIASCKKLNKIFSEYHNYIYFIRFIIYTQDGVIGIQGVAVD